MEKDRNLYEFLYAFKKSSMEQKFKENQYLSGMWGWLGGKGEHLKTFSELMFYVVCLKYANVLSV